MVSSVMEIDPDEDIRPFVEDTGEEPEPGYDDWFRRQVEAALEKQRNGTATYHSLESVMRRFKLLP